MWLPWERRAAARVGARVATKESVTHCLVVRER